MPFGSRALMFPDSAEKSLSRAAGRERRFHPVIRDVQFRCPITVRDMQNEMSLHTFACIGNLENERG
jgi:hypothetical protein